MAVLCCPGLSVERRVVAGRGNLGRLRTAPGAAVIPRPCASPTPTIKCAWSIDSENQHRRRPERRPHMRILGQPLPHIRLDHLERVTNRQIHRSLPDRRPARVPQDRQHAHRPHAPDPRLAHCRAPLQWPHRRHQQAPPSPTPNSPRLHQPPQLRRPRTPRDMITPTDTNRPKTHEFAKPQIVRPTSARSVGGMVLPLITCRMTAICSGIKADQEHTDHVRLDAGGHENIPQRYARPFRVPDAAGAPPCPLRGLPVQHLEHGPVIAGTLQVAHETTARQVAEVVVGGSSG